MAGTTCAPLLARRAHTSEPDAARALARRALANPGTRSFGVLLVDGLSNWEEYVAAALYESLGNVPLVGGSAAANRSHPQPAVYYEGKFLHDAAVLALFETQHL